MPPRRKSIWGDVWMLPLIAVIALFSLVGYKQLLLRLLFYSAALLLLMIIVRLLRLPTLSRATSATLLATHLVFALTLACPIVWMCVKQLSEPAICYTIIITEAWICTALAARKLGKSI